MVKAKSENQKGITIVGSGNVAWHLSHAFFNAGVHIDGIISRNRERGQEIARKVNSICSSSISDIDAATGLVFICVSDDVIDKLAHKLVHAKIPVAHTAASVSIDVFGKDAAMAGVFYPFQTLTRGVRTGELIIPVCLEAGSPEMFALLESFATKISKQVFRLNSEQRILLHIAGIMANNFTNYFFTRATEFLENKGIEPELLFPLISETINKLETGKPAELQTGPARRGNTAILEKHVQLLSDNKDLAHLYSIISDSILAFYKNRHE